MKIVKRGDVSKLEIDFESHLLISGATGKSKKTTAIGRICHEAIKKGATIVILANSKNNVEAGSCIFPITEKWHLEKLKFQEEEPYIQQIKLYHSPTNNFPNKKLYPYEIGTFDIREYLDRTITSFLFETSTETSSLSALNNQIENLSKKDSYFNLIQKIKTQSTSTQYSTIMNYFQKLKLNPLFFPSTSKYNFNFEKILKDNKHFHIFDNRFHQDPKIKVLNNLLILNAIKKVKEEGKVKNQVVIVMDELKSFVPAQPQFQYQSILAKILSDLISTLRSIGVMFVTATQSIFAIDQNVMQSFSDIIQGRTTALQELKQLSQIIGLNHFDRQEIMSLQPNQFVLLSQLNIGILEPYTFHVAPFNYFSSGQHFDRMAEKYYPDKLISHKALIEEVKKDYKDQEKTAEKRDLSKKPIKRDM